jgi:hypothetical protein
MRNKEEPVLYVQKTVAITMDQYLTNGLIECVRILARGNGDIIEGIPLIHRNPPMDGNGMPIFIARYKIRIR